MAVIKITSFAGVSPKTPARYLQESQAQTALNTDIFSGSLKPMKAYPASDLQLSKALVPGTIYRFGEDVTNHTQYWFHWAEDVDVVRGPVADDTTERTFFTGLDFPRVTNADLAIQVGGTNYPYGSRRLGVPAPTAAPTATTSGIEDETATPETRVYVYTFVNSWGEESAPSPVSGNVDVTPTTQSVDLTNLHTAAPSGWSEADLSAKRIYRAVMGTYLYVAEIPIAQASYTDTKAADELGEELPSLTWLTPPPNAAFTSALKGLIALPNGIMAGFTGQDVHFCEPYRPFAWPVGFSQTVDAPIVGLGRMDTTLVVLTEGAPYFIQGTHPESMAVVKADIEQACVSKRSIVSVNGSVIYASPDGLVMLSSGGSKIITEQLFTCEQWQALTPSGIHAYKHNNRYIAFHGTSGFIFDLTTGWWSTFSVGLGNPLVYPTCAFQDMRHDTLYVAYSDRNVYRWQEGTTNFSYTWKSKRFTLPRPLSFSWAHLEAESYPVTAKIYADGTLVHTQSVASRAPFRLPVTVARDWEVQIEGSSEVFAFYMAQSGEELANA